MRRYTRLLQSLLLFAMKTVLCQDPKAYIGDQILLPCVYKGGDSVTGVSVYWTDKDDKVVLNIFRGAENVSSQDQLFSGRVKSFPNEYQRGNFSIVLKNIKKTDAGDFDCDIPQLEYRNRVHLTVAGNRVTEGMTTTTENVAVGLTPFLPTLFCLLLSLI